MTNELEQEIIELEKELNSLNSYILDLHINYDEEIKTLDNKITDLEYELFMEKTREPKNKFYWFTAKKIPLIVDISYSYTNNENENDFYGFKQVPNYHFIEKHDLRFITNCSLDDLIEQFK